MSLALTPLLAAGCGARTDIGAREIESAVLACPSLAPTCVVDGSGCDPATTVEAVCDGHAA